MTHQKHYTYLILLIFLVSCTHAAESSFEITKEQQENFTKDGFVLLPGAISPELLERLRAAAKDIEDRAHAGDESMQKCTLVTHNADVGMDLIHRSNALFADHKHPDLVLDVLASPALTELSRTLCVKDEGTDLCVPFAVDLLFKREPILWHQGAVHPGGYPYLNIAIYLDDSEGKGSAKYVPGSHKTQVDICSHEAKHGWLAGVEVPAKAGDVIVSDMMIVHGSESVPDPKKARRILYVEMRPTQGWLESNTQSMEWLHFQEKFMGLVIRRSGDPARFSSAWQRGYNVLKDRLRSDVEEMKQIHAAPGQPLPSKYCHLPPTGRDPIPGYPQ